jgi:hypothetical protein
MLNILQTLSRSLSYALGKIWRNPPSREPRTIVIRSDDYKPGRKEEKALNDLIQEVETIEEFTFVDRYRLLKYVKLGNEVDKKENETANSSENSLKERFLGEDVADSYSVTNKQIINSLLPELKKYRDLYKDNQIAQFVLERTKARKVIIKPDNFSVLSKAGQIAVWVSDPDPEELQSVFQPSSRIHAKGRFLYLVENYWGQDCWAFFNMSGLSALRLLLVEMFDREKVIREIGTLSKYGKMHSVTVLERFGGVVMPEQEIITLYSRQYTSNDQFFDNEYGSHRCYDTLAILLFIAGLKG